MDPDPESEPPTLAQKLAMVDAVLGRLSRRLPPHVSREDLASAGKVALVEALTRTDGTAAACEARVRGAMLDELRRLDPLSRRSRSQVNLIRRTAGELERSLGRPASTHEIAETAGITVEAVCQIEQLATAAQVCSVHELETGGLTQPILVDHDATCPARSAEADDLARSIREALDRLPANHAHVIRRYYLEDATLDEIAVELALSKERVRQLREAAARRLREDFMVLALWQSFLNRPNES